MPAPRRIAALVLSGLGMTAIYAAVIWSATGWTVAHSIVSSAQAVLVAAALAPIPLTTSSRKPWPSVFQPGFVAAHIVIATAYSLLWIIGVEAVAGLRQGWPGMDSVINPQLPQRLFVGGTFYSLIAAIAYNTASESRARTAERRAAVAEAAAANARLAALQNRLHPHFLFNALNTVAELMHEDVVRAEEAIEQLGDILRILLEREEAMISLDEEWRFVSKYLALEKLRLSDRLRLEVDIDPQCREVRLPSFTLQTLVENAIKHAVAPRAGGGTVSISASLDGQLVVAVDDDGPGPNQIANSETTGIGLTTLRTRLEATYGEPGQLQITVSPLGGTRGLVRIPIQ